MPLSIPCTHVIPTGAGHNSPLPCNAERSGGISSRTRQPRPLLTPCSPLLCGPIFYFSLFCFLRPWRTFLATLRSPGYGPIPCRSTPRHQSGRAAHGFPHPELGVAANPFPRERSNPGHVRVNADSGGVNAGCHHPSNPPSFRGFQSKCGNADHLQTPRQPCSVHTNIARSLASIFHSPRHRPSADEIDRIPSVPGRADAAILSHCVGPSPRKTPAALLVCLPPPGVHACHPGPSFR